jgi:hypothetical protein
LQSRKFPVRPMCGRIDLEWAGPSAADPRSRGPTSGLDYTRSSSMKPRVPPHRRWPDTGGGGQRYGDPTCSRKDRSRASDRSVVERGGAWLIVDPRSVGTGVWRTYRGTLQAPVVSLTSSARAVDRGSSMLGLVADATQD